MSKPSERFVQLYNTHVEARGDSGVDFDVARWDALLKLLDEQAAAQPVAPTEAKPLSALDELRGMQGNWEAQEADARATREQFGALKVERDALKGRVEELERLMTPPSLEPYAALEERATDAEEQLGETQVLLLVATNQRDEAIEQAREQRSGNASLNAQLDMWQDSTRKLEAELTRLKVDNDEKLAAADRYIASLKGDNARLREDDAAQRKLAAVLGMENIPDAGPTWPASWEALIGRVAQLTAAEQAIAMLDGERQTIRGHLSQCDWLNDGEAASDSVAALCAARNDLARDNARLSGELEGQRQLKQNAAAELAEAEQTITDRDSVIEALRGSEQAWMATAKEMGDELRKRDAVVEAARDVVESFDAGLVTSSGATISRVRTALSALDQPATPLEAPDSSGEAPGCEHSIPTDIEADTWARCRLSEGHRGPHRVHVEPPAERPVVVGSTWMFNGCLNGNPTPGLRVVDWFGIDSVHAHYADDPSSGTNWSRLDFYNLHTWVSDPVENPVVESGS